MRLFAIAFAVSAALLGAQTARAEVASSSASQFVIEAEAETSASPEEAWRALSR
jgi:hypothetical protein